MILAMSQIHVVNQFARSRVARVGELKKNFRKLTSQ